MALRRPYIRPNSVYLPAPVSGWNPDGSPWTMTDTQAPVLDNLIPHGDRVSVRGPMAPWTQWNNGSVASGIVGWMMGNDSGGPWFLGGSTASAGNLMPADIPWFRFPSALSVTASTTLQFAENINPITGSAGTVDHVPGPRFVNYDGTLYGISLDSAGAVVHDAGNTYTMKPLSMITLAATQSSPLTPPIPTVQAAAPHGAIDITAYQNRIWLLGGVDTPAGLSVHTSSRLYYTNPGAAGIGSASADWKDPVAATTNIIDIAPDGSDPGVALGRTKAGLVIFRRNSIWILRGNTVSNSTLVNVSRSVGCADQRSVVESDRGLFFLSMQGLMFTDGIQVKNVSGPALRTLQTALGIARQYPLASGYATVASLSDGQIIISIGQYVNSPLNMTLKSLWCGVYNPDTGAWWRLTSQAFGSDTLAGGNPANLYPGQVVSQASPRAVFSVGMEFLVAIEEPNSGWSILQGSGLAGTGVKGLYDATATGGGNWTSIPVQWVTRFVPVITGSSRWYGLAEKYYIDYIFAANPATFLLGHGFTVQPQDASGVAQGPSINVANNTNILISTGNSSISGSAPVAAPVIQHQNADLTFEVSDLQFRVLFFDPNVRANGPIQPIADIFGIGLEYTPAREYRQ